MKKLLSIIFTFILFYSQSQSTINSKIIDENSGQPLPFVNILIKNTTKGVISNSDGNFRINVDKNQYDNFLVFSIIGYEKKEIQISNLIEKSIIKLKPTTTILDEVYLGVSTKDLSANEIVQKAFDNFYLNFPSKPYLAKGFLRHTEKTNKEYKWLIEAAIEKLDKGYKEPSNQIMTDVLEIRKSLDNRQIDTLTAFKWYLEQAKGLSVRKAWIKTPNLKSVSEEEIQNAIAHHDNYFSLHGWKKSYFNSLFNSDLNVVRYYNQKKATLSKKNLFKKFSFKIDTSFVHNSDLIYKIKISAPKKSYKEFGKNFIPLGWIYVNKNNYRILEFEYIRLIVGKNTRIFNELSNSRVISHSKFKFKEINGKMFMYYMMYEQPKWNRLHDVMKSIVDKNVNNKDELHYYTKEEIIFTEFITDEDSIKERIEKKWNPDLFSKRNYNPEFWKNYPVLLENYEQEKLRKDLEKKVKLKEQFEQNKKQ